MVLCHFFFVRFRQRLIAHVLVIYFNFLSQEVICPCKSLLSSESKRYSHLLAWNRKVFKRVINYVEINSFADGHSSRPVQAFRFGTVFPNGCQFSQLLPEEFCQSVHRLPPWIRRCFSYWPQYKGKWFGLWTLLCLSPISGEIDNTMRNINSTLYFCMKFKYRLLSCKGG